MNNVCFAQEELCNTVESAQASIIYTFYEKLFKSSKQAVSHPQCVTDKNCKLVILCFKISRNSKF